MQRDRKRKRKTGDGNASRCSTGNTSNDCSDNDEELSDTADGMDSDSIGIFGPVWNSVWSDELWVDSA